MPVLRLNEIQCRKWLKFLHKDELENTAITISQSIFEKANFAAFTTKYSLLQTLSI